MPGLDFSLDPITLDLVDDGAGGFASTATAATAVQHQMQCHLGEWWGDADAGSLLHTLVQRDDGEETQAFIGDEAQRAAQPLVADGRIAAVTTDVSKPYPGRLFTSVSFQDLQTGQPVDLVLRPREI